jgi:hypothetical protein
MFAYVRLQRIFHNQIYLNAKSNRKVVFKVNKFKNSRGLTELNEYVNIASGSLLSSDVRSKNPQVTDMVFFFKLREHFMEFPDVGVSFFSVFRHFFRLYLVPS